MDQQPSSAARPSVVTTVAVLLFIRGGLSIIGGIIAITGGGFLAGFGGTGTLVVIGLIAIIIGAVEIWAGTGVLKLQEQARMVAVAVVGIDAVLTIIYLIQGASGGIIGLGLDAFVIWALVQNKELFT
jgi:low temperature requirement protein LtrA